MSDWGLITDDINGNQVAFRESLIAAVEVEEKLKSDRQPAQRWRISFWLTGLPSKIFSFDADRKTVERFLAILKLPIKLPVDETPK